MTLDDLTDYTAFIVWALSNQPSYQSADLIDWAVKRKEWDGLTQSTYGNYAKDGVRSAVGKILVNARLPL